ncbi:MAG: hypothetical protein JXB05_04180 [Myxococcaceae bacterium]|nr:hypothetical protein [Myxococcaceae bacterium]
MSIWKRLAERMRGMSRGADRTPPEGDVGMTYADLERDKARKEAMLSGEGFIAGAGMGEFPASRTGSDEPVRGSEDET